MRKILIISFMALFMAQASAQIDLHSHAITQGYLDYIKANGAEMDEGFPIPGWDVEKHIAFMDKAGIQTSVLTMPAPQPFFGDAEASAAVCRKYNEECAALKARYPGRFMFCAALPLPDVPHALEEAHYALEVLGADGIKLATNSYGQYLGDPALDTLMAYLNALLTITTPDHILYGSDYPYVAEPVLISGKQALEGRLASHGLNPQDIFTDNARRLFGENVPLRQYGERIVRLAEIEVVPEYLEEYLTFAKEVGETSVKVEPGVLTLFSMQTKEDPCKIYILEIYADKEAYQSHLQTAHFKKYKEGTAQMVKSLKLIDTKPMVGMKQFGKIE